MTAGKLSAGKFITIEGTEGVGKTTNVAFVQSYLESRGIDLLVTREPGGTPLAEELREILLARRDEAVDPTAELLLVFAARAQHLNRVIKPALAAGKWVLCDRFTDATYAYQGCGRGLSLTVIAELESMVQQSLRPDKTFILDIDVKLGLERAGRRGELDRFETEEVNFFERVRAGYQQRAQDNPTRYCTVNAGQSLVDVQAELQRGLDIMLQGF